MEHPQWNPLQPDNEWKWMRDREAIKARIINEWNKCVWKYQRKNVKTKTPKINEHKKQQWQIINVHILKMVYMLCTQWFHLVVLIKLPKRNEAIPIAIVFFRFSSSQMMCVDTSFVWFAINSLQIWLRNVSSV